MTKDKLFRKLKPLKKVDRILLLTHTDMDGATPVVLNQIFKDVDVWHCTNNSMSWMIKKAVYKEAANYDAIVVTDISCKEVDAEQINNMPGCRKLILLDHHPTATFLNDYSWAVVYPELVDDSFRAKKYDNPTEGHSSGTSLLFDYLEYQGLTADIANLDLLKEYVDNVATYDTWDWENVFGGIKDPKDLADIESAYGLSMFERIYSKKVQNGEPLLNENDRQLLADFKKEEQDFISNKKGSVICGTLASSVTKRDYSFAMIVTADYSQAAIEYLRREYLECEIYIVNEGKGISVRS